MIFEAKFTRPYSDPDRTRTARVWRMTAGFVILCEVGGHVFEEAEAVDIDTALSRAREWVDR